MRHGQSHSEETKKKISDIKRINPSRFWLGKKRSPEDIEKFRKSHIGKPSFWKGKKRPDQAGKNSYFWKGGITPANTLIRTSAEYKLWREAVFKRDEYTCIWCGARNGNGKAVILHADHIKPFSSYPELRLAIDNGRTLCIKCHETTDSYKGRGRKLPRR